MVRGLRLKKAAMSIIESLTAAVKEHQAGHLDVAEARYREILCRQPDHTDTLNALGVLLCQTGHPETAVGLLERAVTLGDPTGFYHCNLGEALRASGRLDEAVAALQIAITRSPTDAQSHYNFGLTLEKLGRYAEAIGHFQTAIQHNPHQFDCYFSLANSLRQVGRIEDAMTEYDRIIELFPEQTQAKIYRQQLQEQHDAATAAAQREESLENLSEQEIYLRLSRRQESQDNLLYRGLCRAIQNGDVRIAIDLKRINHIDCPVAGDAFSTQFIYAVVIIAALVGWSVSWLAGAGVLAAGILAYWLGGRRIINQRTERYVLKQIFQDGALWDRLWRFGGVTLSCPGKGRWVTCTAPQGDWRIFIAEFLKTA